jgi:pyruvate,orthophosphate dikinase
MPDVYKQLFDIGQRLEQHFREMQDIEFTIEHGRLYMLQTRTAKRTAAAAVRVAVDMVGEKLISKDEGVMRVPPNDLTQLLLPRFDEDAKKQAVADGRLLGKGLNASPGAATGRAVFEVDASTGPGFILVRPETSADDMPGILRAKAVLTSRGGITSHAAVVTRGLGKPAVVGCTELKVDVHNRRMTVDGTTVNEGDEISVDGFTGEVFAGHIATVDPDVSSNDELRTLLGWADELRRLGVRANADTPRDAQVAVDFGAQGIGLCRTEHMFFQEERLPYVRDMLMGAAETARILRDVKDARIAVEMARGSERADAEKAVKEAEAKLESEDAKRYRAALEKLGEYQCADFRDILRVMDGKPVVIRLLDAPLHEFLPPHEHVLQEVAALRATKPDSAELKEKEELLGNTRSLQESNPMLGHRGSRLGLTYPEVYQMQVRAIVRAALELLKEGKDPRPEVMVPLVMGEAEVNALKEHLADILAEYEGAAGKKAPLHFGTMIELPRAALMAGKIAPEVEFFSFGSNDLTQMTFGFSRDDAEEKFLSFYLETGLVAENPFASIDQDGVGRLVQIAAEEGRAANPKLELGICGEHGGDPESIEFCNRVGLNYVSCSPMRVPIARLAAAQVALGAGEKRDA